MSKDKNKMDMAAVKEILGGPTVDVVAAAEAASDKERAMMLEAELSSPSPREPVVTALGGEMPAAPAAEAVEEDDGVETLDPSMPFEMVHYNDTKHLLQGNKIFDVVSKKFICRADGK